MNPEQLAALVLSWQSQPDFPQRVAQLRPQLSLETVAALKRRVDDEKLRNARRALQIATVAQTVAAAIGTLEAQALADWARGNALYHLSRYQDALDCYRHAQAMYEARGQRLEVACLQSNQVAVLRDMSEFGAAITLAEEARAACEALGPPARRYLASLEMNVGAAYRQMGDLERALATYERGRAMFTALGDAVETARIDINRANVLQEMDRYGAAEQLLVGARAALALAGRDQELARADLYLGTLAYRRGRYQEALRYLEAAHSGFAAIPNPAEIAMVDLYRSFVYRELNLLQETIALAAGAERQFKRDRAGWLRAMALINQGGSYRRLGEYAAAERALAQARRLLRRQAAHTRILTLDLERAYVALEGGLPGTARRLARRVARQLAAATWPALAARLEILLARCALAGARPDPAAAQRHATAARTIAEEYDLPEAGTAAHLIGRLSEQAGDLQEAWRRYQAAIGVVERVRARLPLDELHLSFMDDKLPIYEDAARLSRRVASPAQALYTLNLAHSAPLIRLATAAPPAADDPAADALHIRLRGLREAWHWYQNKLEQPGELRAHTAQAYAPAGEDALRTRLRALEDEIAELARRLHVRATPSLGEPASAHPDAEAWLAGIRQRLGPRDALLHYFAIGESFGVALVTRTTLRFIPELAPTAELQRVLRSWRFRLECAPVLSQATHGAATPHLARLYQALFAPLERDLADREQLLLVLPPGWHDLPFAALFDGRTYLAERFELTHLSAPEALLQPPPDPSAPSAGSGGLVVGYSEDGRLPHTIDEAQQVAAALGAWMPATCLVEGQATLDRVRALMPASRMLHLATHAVFRPDNPLFSWMRLADARLTVADIYDITLRQRPLVVLSACETGRGQPRGGGLLGMGRALLGAGAAGLIVSLWKIPDVASAQLMADMYQHLALAQPHHSAGAALRRAQRLALARGEPPFCWAGFVAIQG